MRSCFRQRNMVTSRLLRSMHVAGRAMASGGTREVLDEFSGDEVAAGLGWSRSMAGRWLELADDLVGRLPQVLELMERGVLDDGKARVLSEWTRDLSVEHARQVCALVLPVAAGVPLAGLIERVQEVAIALDPGWAARREARARSHARVVSSANPSGTGNLSGYDLPGEEAVAALSRVEAIAAEVRRRGVRVPIARLRATVYLRLLDGFSAGLDDDAVIRALVELLRDPDPDPGPEDPGPEDPGPDDPGPGPGPDEGPAGPDEPGPAEPDDEGPAGRDDPGPAEPDDEGPDDRGDPGPADPENAGGPDNAGGPAGQDDERGPDPAGAGPDPGDDPDPGDPGVGTDADADAESADADVDVDVEPPPTRGLRQGTVELRLRLSTALGLDNLPARIPGWGAVLAATARSMLRAPRDAEWRLVLTDDDGHLLHVILARHRPPGPRRPGRGARVGRGIVELQVPTTLLAALTPSQHPPWAALLADAQDRLRALPAEGSCPDHGPAATDAATRRRARAELDRWVRTRDRHCVGMNCRLRAQRCDLDHTHNWARRGPTRGANLGPLCGHNHRAKHHGGWRLRQPEPGMFVWTSRAGTTYLQPARRITEPLPAPTPERRQTPHPADTDDAEPPPFW